MHLKGQAPLGRKHWQEVTVLLANEGVRVSVCTCVWIIWYVKGIYVTKNALKQKYTKWHSDLTLMSDFNPGWTVTFRH